MWRPRIVTHVLWLSLLAGCQARPPVDVAPPTTPPLDVIAFGSCARQDLPQPIWDRVLDVEPDLFLFLGDNIYSDGSDAAALFADYAALAAHDGFARLRAQVPLMATWDDHDYGVNDGGADNADKHLYERAFLDFFEEPADSPRRARDGIYHARTFGPPGRRVQVIILDTRFFRGPLIRNPAGESTETGRYVRNLDPRVTMLGDAQWAWLEARLREPAELRVIASSVQVVADDHGWEKWGNLPHERARLFRTIRAAGAEGVIVFSGDRHFGDLSMLPADDPVGVGYPLYDLTASGMTAATVVDPRLEGNRYRAASEAGVFAVHFGVLRVDWGAPEATVALEIHALDGTVMLRQSVPLRLLRRSSS